MQTTCIYLKTQLKFFAFLAIFQYNFCLELSSALDFEVNWA